MPDNQTAQQSTTQGRRRIGLALSGGGFRASIFHLGVIRRLEELHIMKDVEVISSVSGGSILAAYYACEMEDQLRLQPDENWEDPQVRLAAYKAVARTFLDKVELNMRSRALVSTPFYHPWLFLKSLFLKPFRAHARSILIQAEYDQHFYHGHTLDQLPAVSPDRVLTNEPVLTGPKLLLNTTSLMTGERKSFSRDANTKLAELKSSNKNVLRLSQIVGASSGVPVVFPPTSVCGELLVDGGVSDNQGIEGLLEVYLAQGSQNAGAGAAGGKPDDYLLISDASGQLELKHTQSTSSLPIYSRVSDILQHQVRNKLLALISTAYNEGRIRFAFVHLLLNLKDDGRIKKRVSSDFIEPLARIRTDLDQFSYIEVEALMYHGYTLIDAMVKKWCPELLPPGDPPPLHTPPLFRDNVQRNQEKRSRIQKELVAGNEKMFLLRSWTKHQWKTIPIFAPAILAWVAIIFVLFRFPEIFVTPTVGVLQKYMMGALYGSAIQPIRSLAGWLQWQGVAEAIDRLQEFLDFLIARAAEIGAALLLAAAPLYMVTFFAWAAMRRLALALDRQKYIALTGAQPGSLDWEEAAETSRDPVSRM